MKITAVLIVGLALLCGAECRRLNAMTWLRFPRFFNKQSATMQSAAVSTVAEYYDQRVDHFNPLSSDTFKQLFFQKDFGSGSNNRIVFFYFNGEGPLASHAVDGDNFVIQTAKRYKAILVTHEHRYYGTSFPTKDLSTSNLRFLSTEQALEDAAQFQTWFSKSHNLNNATWVICGGSYSGFLSTAYRVRYPHLVQAAWSSSGVVLPKVDYVEYFQTVDTDFSWNSKCYAAMQNMSDTVTSLWKTQQGRETIKSLFNICDTLADKDEADMWNLLTNPAAGAAQYGSTDSACATILSGNTPLEGYAKLFSEVGKSIGGAMWGEDCVDIDWKTQEKDIKLVIPYDGDRTWMWQTCSEFGWYQTTTQVKWWSKKLDVNYFLDACDIAFARGLRPNTDRVIYNYGGMKPEGSQILSCSGLADPWHSVCQSSTYRASEPVFFIDAHDASHCKDMSAPKDSDSQQLKEARNFITKNLDTWLTKKSFLM
eukprot:TRINITY_DN439_c0_g1_i1.p1 TRINITY_DN439_c0_g1~~TRINITY_DN439_c0_g1_i1.p1  ORF type:complete len:481 (+),score=118.16 TRINITY_DN439_c0_g1_i1:1-1443(+)